MDGLDQTVLGDGIEKAYQIVVDCIEIHGNWCVLKVVVEMVPEFKEVVGGDEVGVGAGNTGVPLPEDIMSLLSPVFHISSSSIV